MLVGETWTTDLLEALNLWTSQQEDPSLYSEWCEDINNENEGLPLFCIMPTETEETAISDNKAMIFPNPTKGNFFIQLPSGETANKISIYNAIGTLVVEQNATELNLQNAPSGLYFVVVETESGKTFKNKIVKK